MKKSLFALSLFILGLSPKSFAQDADAIVGGTIIVKTEIPANTYFQNGKIVKASQLKKEILWCGTSRTGAQSTGTYELAGFETFNTYSLSNQQGTVSVSFVGSNSRDSRTQVGFDCWQSVRPLKVINAQEIQEAFGSYVQIKALAAGQSEISSWLPPNLNFFSLTLESRLTTGCVYFRSGAILPGTKCFGFDNGDGIVPDDDYVALENTEGWLYTIEANTPQQVESVNIKTNFDRDLPQMRGLALYFKFQNHDFELMALSSHRANRLFNLEDIQSYLGPRAHIELQSREESVKGALR